MVGENASFPEEQAAVSAPLVTVWGGGQGLMEKGKIVRKRMGS
jgi:hypothetical protein